MNRNEIADVLDNIQVGAPDDRANEALGLAGDILRGDGWQPIDTAPKDGAFIVGWAEDWDVPVCLLWSEFYNSGAPSTFAWGHPGERRPDGQPTYWHPLQPIPKP